MAITLVDQTYDALLNMIITKEYKPGDRFPSELQLCEQFGVSRNTIRAAINKLCALGFTETRHGGGTFVKEVGSDVYLNFFIPAVLTHDYDLLEIMQFRAGLEIEVAKVAAEMATEEDINKLEAMLKTCTDLAERKAMPELAGANNDFHNAIAQASHNKLLIKMLDIIKTMILPEMQCFLDAQGEDIDSLFYHEMVLKCIINKRPSEAAFCMEKHMELVVERVKNYKHINYR